MDNWLIFAKMIAYDPFISTDAKDQWLASTMTILEQKYGISMFRNDEWEKKNPDIIRVYKEISKLRSI